MVQVICKHTMFANYWDSNLAALPQSPLLSTRYTLDSSHKWHLMACEASALPYSALSIGEMDGTGNGELGPSSLSGHRTPTPFLLFLVLPSLSPITTVKPFLVSRFVSWLFKDLPTRPQASHWSAEYSASLLSLEPSQQLQRLQLGFSHAQPLKTLRCFMTAD